MCKIKIKALALIICASFAGMTVRGGKSAKRILYRICNTETLMTKSFYTLSSCMADLSKFCA